MQVGPGLTPDLEKVMKLRDIRIIFWILPPPPPASLKLRGNGLCYYLDMWPSEFRPDMGCIWCWIRFGHQTFINSRALLVSLMPLQLAHVDQNTFQPWFCCFFCLQTFMNCFLIQWSTHSSECFCSLQCTLKQILTLVWTGIPAKMYKNLNMISIKLGVLYSLTHIFLI